MNHSGHSVKKSKFRPTFVGKATALVAGTLIAIVLGELLVRAFVPAPHVKAIQFGSDRCVYQRSTNPVLGFELKSNYRDPNPDFIERYERTNSHGQRDQERTIAKPAGTSRVLLLGDSVVEGYGLPETATISNQLQALYDRDHAETPTEVLNFGVSAYCTLAEIELLMTKGVQFAPDHVVLVFVENDFDNFNREAFPLGAPVDRPAWTEVLFKRSHVWRQVCLQFNLFQFRAQADPVAWNQQAIGDNNVSVGLKRFRELANQHHFEPLIAIWPRFLDDRVTDVHQIPDSDVLIVEVLAAINQIPSFRLSQYFQTDLEARSRTGDRAPILPRLLYSQGDELHPSPEGARIAAQAIHDQLANGKGNSATTYPNVDTAKLEQALMQVGSNAPNYARVFNRVGNDYLKQGQFTPAAEQYKKALHEDDRNAAAHNNLGIALERSGQAGAIDHYQKAIALEPDFAEAHYNLANVLEPVDRDQAQQHWIRAIEIQPEFVAAHYRLSRLLLRRGRVNAAVAGFGEVLRLDPKHTSALRALASELVKQRRFPEALSCFERLVAIEPNDAEALNNLGAIHSSLGNRQAAVKYMKAAVAADPDHPKAAANLRKLMESSSLE